MKKLKNITLKTGAVDEFMNRAKDIMRAAGKKEAVQPSHTLIFEDPAELLHFLSKQKELNDYS